MTLTHTLGLDVPIIQAPMAGTQGEALAAAVCLAGGLGSIPSALLGLDEIRNAVAAVAAKTPRSVNLNFFCHEAPSSDTAREEAWRRTLAPYYAELGVEVVPVSAPAPPARRPFDTDAAALVTHLRPAVVSFHFGLPADDLLAVVKRSGSLVFATATTVDEAVWLESKGVDAVIAQGLEAGGHRGMFLTEDVTTQVGTIALVPQIVRAVNVPVIAAGGIADRQGVTAALALGASAVQVGTAYLLCPEASTSAVHRAALVQDDARHTAITNIFTGRPARAIVNRLIRECGALRDDVPRFPLASSAILPLRAAAEARGRDDFSPNWAGQNTSGCRSIPAGQLTRELAGA